MTRIAQLRPAFPATPIAITPGTDVYGASSKAVTGGAAQRFLLNDPDYVTWVAEQSPPVAKAVEQGFTTLGVLRDVAKNLKGLNPAALKKAWEHSRLMAKHEPQLVSVRQNDAARQAKLLLIKAKAPAWLRDELILVPGGLFMMGAEDHKKGYPVWVSAHLMLSTKVTNAMWKTKMADSSVQYGDEFTSNDYPVVGVDRDDALAYLRKVQQDLTDLRLAGRVSLPTEAQWERAARADRDFIHGTDDGTLSHNKAIYGNRKNQTHTAPVTSRPANSLGFYDMCGNASEWCRDGWDQIYYNTELQIDPTGYVLAESYVVHGGSWFTTDLRELRATHRFNLRAAESYNFLSFRFVIEPEDSDL